MFLYAYNVVPFSFNARLYKVYKKRMLRHHKKNIYDLIDVRGLKVLEEHKKIIFFIINQLAPNYIDISEYEKVYEKSNIMLMLATKYNITKKIKKNYLIE